MRLHRQPSCVGVPARNGVCRRSVAACAASADLKEPEARAASGDPTPQQLRQLEDLPVESGMPVFGSIFQIVDENFELASLFEKHDTDALHVNLGPGIGWMVAMQDEELMEQVSFSKNTFPKWPAGVEGLILAQNKSLTNEENRPWRAAQTKILSQGLVMRLQLPLIVSEFTEVIRGYAKTGEEVKWFDVSKRLTFSAACRAAVGDILSRKELDEMFAVATVMGHGVFSPNFGVEGGIPFTTHWRSRQAHAQLCGMLSAKLKPLIQTDRAVLDGEKTVMREVLVALEEEGVDTTTDVDAISDRIAREIIMMMFVGTDTTSYILSRSLVWLSKNPEWLQALSEEQQRLVAEHGPELNPTVLKDSAVALAVAQETFRLTPPVRVMYRRAQQDLVIGDIMVPEGTDIVMCPRKAILATGSGKREFDPEHWLNEDRTKCTPNDEMGNYVFGKGPRNCVGRNLAIIETMAFLAVLGREVAEVQMSQEEQDRTFFIIGDHPTGLPLTLKPREP